MGNLNKHYFSTTTFQHKGAELQIRVPDGKMLCSNKQKNKEDVAQIEELKRQAREKWDRENHGLSHRTLVPHSALVW